MALAAVCVAAVTVGTQPATLGQRACVWSADVLPLPHNAIEGRVTAGDGDWLAGATGAGAALLWRDGRLVVLGRAFGLDTHLSAVNPGGVAVGYVTEADGARRAVRYRDGFEYLPGGSEALDVDPEGTVVGYDGPTLVVWTAGGTRRTLPMPAGEYPFGRPSIDDDGTVVARTGKVADGTVRWRVHAWAPDGTRRALPASDGVLVEDVRHGRVIGLVAQDAVVWTRGDRTVLPRGASVAAVNADGVVVGAGPDERSLIWRDGGLPKPLPPPRRHFPGAVTAMNDDEPGGYSFPPGDGGSVPVRWRCHTME